MNLLAPPTQKRSRVDAVPPRLSTSKPIVTAEFANFGAFPLTVYSHQSYSNLLKMLMFWPKKVRPQTKFAAILNL
jgi:hypothetical protein